MNGVVGEERVQRDARDDAGQRDRQDEQKRDGVPAEEAEAADRGRRGRAEDDGAIAVAIAAAFSDRTSALRASSLCHAAWNHLVLNPAIGQLWMFEELKA